MKYFFLGLSILACTVQLFSQTHKYNEVMEQYKYNIKKATQINDGAKSLPYSLKAYALAKQIDYNGFEMAKALEEVFADYKRVGNFEEALKYALIKIELEAQNGDDIGLGVGYNMVGFLYLSKGNYDLGISYLNKALAIHIKTNVDLTIGDAYTNLGEGYRMQGKLDSAIFHFKKALHYYDLLTLKTDSVNVDERYRHAYGNGNLGLVHYQMGNIQVGDSMMNICISILEEYNDYFPISVFNYEKAKAVLALGQDAKAEKLALIAYQMAMDNNFNKEIQDIALLLSDIYLKKNDIQQAYDYLQQHYVYRDSLVNTKVISQMAEMRATYEISQKQKEVNFLTTINKTRTRLVFVLSSGLAIIILLLLFLVRLSKKRRQANVLLIEQNHELDQKNFIIGETLKEKEMLMKEIHHRVKNNLQIISSIISLQNLRITDNGVKEIFEEMQRRILAISAIHKKLYQSDSVSLISMTEYIDDIVGAIHIAFTQNNSTISFEALTNNMKLSINAAVSIGLIVNELATNAYKYAFAASENNEFTVKLWDDEAGCTLVISDNGSGIPDDIEILQSNSLGLRMVNLLSRQLNGTVDYKNNNGAEFTIFFANMVNYFGKEDQLVEAE